jgi:hypothetical protein
VLGRLTDMLRPHRCLETNVFSTATATRADLSAEDRTSEIFDFLIRSIRPKCLVVHGTDAVEHIGRLAR